jgi:phytoene dehydrogenase-like protein
VELNLEAHGLHFFRPDPTLVHHFPAGAFIGWRDRAKVEQQIDGFSPGEADRYNRLVAEIEEMGAALQLSLFKPAPALFDAVFHGSLKDLLESHLQSSQAKALLGMVALNVTQTRPSSPGTAMGVILRPLSIASRADHETDDPHHDPRKMALRGATGLPIGGMGAIADALVACCKSHCVEIRRSARVKRVLSANGQVKGALTETGETFFAPLMILSINPQLAFNMLSDDAVPRAMRDDIAKLPMSGSAFKLVLALDRIPRYAGLPADLPNDVRRRNSASPRRSTKSRTRSATRKTDVYRSTR